MLSLSLSYSSVSLCLCGILHHSLPDFVPPWSDFSRISFDSVALGSGSRALAREPVIQAQDLIDVEVGGAAGDDEVG